MKDWKSCERRIAQELDGRRMPVSGRQCGETPDVVHEWLSIEVKSRQRLPAWIEDAMKQAEAAAKDGQLPWPSFTETGGRLEDAAGGRGGRARARELSGAALAGPSQRGIRVIEP